MNRFYLNSPVNAVIKLIVVILVLSVSYLVRSDSFANETTNKDKVRLAQVASSFGIMHIGINEKKTPRLFAVGSRFSIYANTLKDQPPLLMNATGLFIHDSEVLEKLDSQTAPSILRYIKNRTNNNPEKNLFIISDTGSDYVEYLCHSPLQVSGYNFIVNKETKCSLGKSISKENLLIDENSDPYAIYAALSSVKTDDRQISSHHEKKVYKDNRVIYVPAAWAVLKMTTEERKIYEQEIYKRAIDEGKIQFTTLDEEFQVKLEDTKIMVIKVEEKLIDHQIELEEIKQKLKKANKELETCH